MKRLILTAMLLLLSSSIATAQEPCVADFNCDTSVDGLDVPYFLAEWNKRLAISNPCPPCAPLTPVLKTGQTNCYDMSGSVIDCEGTGQDGELQKGFDKFKESQRILAPGENEEVCAFCGFSPMYVKDWLSKTLEEAMKQAIREVRIERVDWYKDYDEGYNDAIDELEENITKFFNK